MPTVRGWAALGVAAALAMLWIGYGELEILATAVFLVAAVAAGAAYTRLAMPHASISRQISPVQVHEGDDVVVEIAVATARRAGNLTLEDCVHGLGIARFAAARPGAHRSLIARYEVLCRTRGVYEVGPAIVGVVDPLGLAERTTIVGEPSRLTVFPRIEPLEGYPAVRGYNGTVQSTRPTYSPHGGEEFFTLREYQVGDDLRKVHWPASAKRDQLMIKQLEIPWQAKALVLLDLRAGRYPDPESFEQAVRGAASAIGHLYRGGFGPELWAGEWAAGLRSGSRFIRAMELLAGIRPTEQVDLRSAVGRLRRSGVGGGALVVVTGRPDTEVIAGVRALSTDFTRTVVMTVSTPGNDAVGRLQGLGAVTVAAGAEASWAPAWRTAMELSWSIASAG